VLKFQILFLHSRLYNTVMKHMIHGPCGKKNKSSPCMDGDECTKKHPKDFAEDTILNDDGYPTYRRQDTGIFQLKRDSVKNPVEVDNRWVVPHNPYLLLDGPGGTGKTFLYNTLINVLQGQGKSIISVEMK